MYAVTSGPVASLFWTSSTSPFAQTSPRHPSEHHGHGEGVVYCHHSGTGAALQRAGGPTFVKRIARDTAIRQDVREHVERVAALDQPPTLPAMLEAICRIRHPGAISVQLRPRPLGTRSRPHGSSFHATQDHDMLPSLWSSVAPLQAASSRGMARRPVQSDTCPCCCSLSAAPSCSDCASCTCSPKLLP